jgi:dienelactone hydrolase
MYSIQLGTAADIEYLVDILPLYIPDLGYSNTKWSVLGFSLGAHSALLASSHIEKISACISVVGCGDYIKLMESRDVSIPPSLEILISKKDPINNIKRLVSKRLLILGGEHDLLVPPWTNLVFTQKLDAYREEYRLPPGTLEVANDPGAKHEFSRFMKYQSISFLKDFFL